VTPSEKSGLRGRGGGGFLTGRKWKMGAQASRATRSTSSATPTKATRAPSWIGALIESDPHNEC